jgi:ABC-type sugar transport system substrate-binding protein
VDHFYRLTALAAAFLAAATPAQAQGFVFLPNVYADYWCQAAQAGATKAQATRYAAENALVPGEPIKLANGSDLDTVVAARATFTACPADVIRLYAP